MVDGSRKADKFRALQQKFMAQLPAKLTELQELWRAMQGNAIEDDHESVHTLLQRQIHSLAGSAGTFGFTRLGKQACEVEALLKAAQYDNGLIENALNNLNRLQNEVPEPPSELASPRIFTAHDVTPLMSLVYVLEDDPLLGKEIAHQLIHFGYEAKVFTHQSDLTAAYTQQLPSALIADIKLPEGILEGPRITSQLHSSLTQTIPTIFISNRDDWEARLMAARGGGEAYLTKPLDFSALVERLDLMCGHRQETPYRILIIEDTPLLAEHYATVLQTAGMETVILNDPAPLLDLLGEFRADLILMDIYMPSCTGTEAARVIRQHSSYQNLPIVYLSTESALEEQLLALREGGDDFLHKTISDQHLISAVAIRAERFRGLSMMMICDSLTGLLNHINMKLALEREIVQVRRRGGNLCFVMVDIDHFKAINDSYGHPVGDRVIKSLARFLKQRLRKSDIAARYGGEEFALILPDTTSDQALVLINYLRAGFAEIQHRKNQGEFTVTFSAGIATVPPSEDMEALILTADTALYEAKQAGRNQVHVKNLSSRENIERYPCTDEETIHE